MAGIRTFAIVGCLALAQSLGCATSSPFKSSSAAPGAPKSGGFFGALFGKSKPAATANYGPTSPQVARDSISLANETAPPDAEFYVSVARLSERNGNVGTAIDHYQRALAIEPKHLGARIGLARLYDRLNNLPEATRQYQQAANDYPGNPEVLNDLALCHARQQNLGEAARCLRLAIDANPRETRFRNNLATVLIETGSVDGAIVELSAVHSPAVAHYNAGYLLESRGRRGEAIGHFRRALELDPQCTPARQWLDYLNASTQSSAPILQAARPAIDPLPQPAAPQPPAAADPPVMQPSAAPAPRPVVELMPAIEPSQPSPTPTPTPIQPLPQPQPAPQVMPPAQTPSPPSPAPPATPGLMGPPPGVPPTPDEIGQYSQQFPAMGRAIPASAIEPLPPISQRLPARY